jgi:hypothetical protein
MSDFRASRVNFTPRWPAPPFFVVNRPKNSLALMLLIISQVKRVDSGFDLTKVRGPFHPTNQRRKI